MFKKLIEIIKHNKRVFKERRKVRAKMKEEGMTSKEDFEIIAREMGLVYEHIFAIPPFLLWFLRGLIAKGTLSMLLSLAGLFLLTAFGWSIVTEQAGSFTINLTSKMIMEGFSLSDTEDFENKTTRLFSEKVKDLTNITIKDIPENIDETDGIHNGDNYVAHTFYIMNEGEEPAAYTYELKLVDETKDVSSAMWIMFFEDDEQLVFARMSDNDKAEGVLGYDEVAPFHSSAYNEEQYIYENGLYGLLTTPFESDSVICSGFVDEIGVGEIRKYTVVIWVEGNDPNCTNDILGGYAKLRLDFEGVYDEDDSIFSGVFDSRNK